MFKVEGFGYTTKPVSEVVHVGVRISPSEFDPHFSRSRALLKVCYIRVGLLYKGSVVPKKYVLEIVHVGVRISSSELTY